MTKKLIEFRPGDKLRVIRPVAGFAQGEIILVDEGVIVEYRRPAYVLVIHNGEKIELPLDSVKKMEIEEDGLHST